MLLVFLIIWSFFFGYNKIHKKLKFSTLDIVESQSKEMSSVSYVTCVDILAQVSLTQWSLYIILDEPKLRVNQLNQPEIILPAAHSTKN